jgi:hypothetical protein
MKQFQVKDSVKNELALILAGTSPDLVKNAKVLGKSFANNKAIANFVADPTPKGVSIIIDAKKRSDMFDAINQYGITDVKTKQAMCIAVLQSDIELHVAGVHSKLTNKGSIELSLTQKDALANALVKYRNFLVKQLTPAVQEIALAMGVTEEVTVAAPVAHFAVAE